MNVLTGTICGFEVKDGLLDMLTLLSVKSDVCYIKLLIKMSEETKI